MTYKYFSLIIIFSHLDNMDRAILNLDTMNSRAAKVQADRVPQAGDLKKMNLVLLTKV